MRKDSVMLNFFLSLTIVIISIAYLPSSFAAEINVPDDQSTIQGAINAANDGDVIILRPGTYMENINFSGKAITIKGMNIDDPNVIASTIIDGNQIMSVVTFNNGEDREAQLCGITICNGAAANGGGIFCSSSSPTISNCIINGNKATGEGTITGGGIACYDNSSPIIANCKIIENSATGSSYFKLDISGFFLIVPGIGTGGGIYCQGSSPTIKNCLIAENSVSGYFSDSSGGSGGGIYCVSSAPIITNCNIIENSAFGGVTYGGGIYCESSSPSIIDCNINGNSVFSIHLTAANAYGGGIYCSHSSSPTIINCNITGNWANGNGGSDSSSDGYGYGGGICCLSSLPTVFNCNIINNKAYGGGGTTDSDPYSANKGGDGYSYGGGIYCDSSSPIITNCIIAKNSTDSSGGYGTIFDPNTYGKSYSYGGGIYCDSSSPIITNCNITYNSSINRVPVSISDPNGFAFEYSLTDGIGGGIVCQNSSSPIVTNSILWSDSPDEIYIEQSSSIFNYCDIQGGYTGTGEENIDANPLFIDPNTGDYHLQVDSPCIDAGSNINIPITDKENVYRPHDGNGDGIAICDIGAYEFSNCSLNTFYQDGDGDGYGNPDTIIFACNMPDGYVFNQDCNDNDPNINPEALEICDGADNNCDGEIDEGYDADGDGYSPCENDCNDNNSNIYPGAQELCNQLDDDCDELMDEEGAGGCAFYYKDEDQDGFGVSGDRRCLCNPDHTDKYTAAQDGDPDDMNSQIPYMEVELNLPKGWSMFSLPVLPANPLLCELFPDAVIVYGYEKGTGYVRMSNEDEFEKGKGYWILIEQEKRYILSGLPIYEYSFSINEAGWYMISGCTSPALSSIDSGNIRAIYSYLQGFGYQRVLESENLKPGQGYWILLSDIHDQAELTVSAITYPDIIPLLPPIAIQATSKGMQIMLVWKNPPEQAPDLYGYEVYYCDCSSDCSGCFNDLVPVSAADPNGRFDHTIQSDANGDPLDYSTYTFTIKARDEEACGPNYSDGVTISVTITGPLPYILLDDFEYEPGQTIMDKGWYSLQGNGVFRLESESGNHYLKMMSDYSNVSAVNYIISKLLSDSEDYINPELRMLIKSEDYFRIDIHLRGSDGKDYWVSYKGDPSVANDSGPISEGSGWYLYTLGWAANISYPLPWIEVVRNLDADLSTALPGVQFKQVIGFILRGTLDIDNIEFPKIVRDVENLTARPGDSEVLLSWTVADPNKIDAARVYVDANVEADLIPSPDRNDYQYQVTGLSNGITYEFKIVQVVEGDESKGVSVSATPVVYKTIFAFDNQADLDEWSLVVSEGVTFDVVYDSGVQSNVMYLNPNSPHPHMYYAAKEGMDLSDVTGMTCRIKTSTNFVIWFHIYDTSGLPFMLGLVPGGAGGSYSRFGNFAYYFLGPGLTDGNWHIIDINIDEVLRVILDVGLTSIHSVYFGGHIWVDDLCFY